MPKPKTETDSPDNVEPLFQERDAAAAVLADHLYEMGAAETYFAVVRDHGTYLISVHLYRPEDDPEGKVQ